jgi:hypothetical protein
MNFKKVVLTNSIIALILSLIGFFTDGDPRTEGISTNVLEIVMMTMILFSVITMTFFAIHFLIKSANKFSVKN